MRTNKKENSDLLLHVTQCRGEVQCGPYASVAPSSTPIFHMFNLLCKSSREQPLHKFFRSSQNYHGKILMNRGLEKSVFVTRQRERERKRTLKRKYFMLFKCVLYYILTAINFIRLFIRAVFHRGLKGE